MARWIAADPSTAAVLRNAGCYEVVIEPTLPSAARRIESMLKAAASSGVIVLLASSLPGKVQVAKFTRHAAANAEGSQAREPEPRYIASGFLGLSDELVLEEPQPRGWWHRFWN